MVDAREVYRLTTRRSLSAGARQAHEGPLAGCVDNDPVDATALVTCMSVVPDVAQNASTSAVHTRVNVGHAFPRLCGTLLRSCARVKRTVRAGLGAAFNLENVGFWCRLCVACGLQTLALVLAVARRKTRSTIKQG